MQLEWFSRKRLARVSRQLTWWLSPAEHDGKRDLAGVALVIGGLCALADRLLAISNLVRAS
jgi:hypothetical protein